MTNIAQNYVVIVKVFQDMLYPERIMKWDRVKKKKMLRAPKERSLM